MPQRVQKLGAALSHRPFEGEGASLYVTTDTDKFYRRLRVLPGLARRRRRRHWCKGSGGAVNIAEGITKTPRVASVEAPTASIDYALPAELADLDVYFDVRTFKDDVENESTQYRTARRVLDENLDDVTEILGTAVLLAQEPRDGGVVRLRFRYESVPDGVQPTDFTAVATAGPTAPADATVTWDGNRIIEIDTPALDDSAPYTYTIRGENGETTRDLLTGIVVQGDASGPPAPTAGTAEAW